MASMTIVMFRCPNTKLRVQRWIAEEIADRETYAQLLCVACPRVHYANPVSGKVLGEGEKDH